MRRVLALVGVLAVIGAALAIPAFADTEGTVTATVTAGVVAISVSTTTVAYGTVEVGSSDNVPTPSTFTATNDGNVDANFGIKGAATTDWALVSGAPTDEEYRHKASPDAFTSTIILTADFQSLDSAVTPTSSTTVSLRLDAPASTAASAEQSAQVIILATVSP